MALFARVGGGIYTKAAEWVSTWSAKVEAGIPEDDPATPPPSRQRGRQRGRRGRHGRRPVRVLRRFHPGHLCAGRRGLRLCWFLPMLLAAVWASSAPVVGTFIKTKETPQQSLLTSLRTGTYLAAVPVPWPPPLPTIVGNWGVYVAILCGLIGGCAIGYFTEYYTSDTYAPQKLAASSETGSATVIIGGISWV